MHEIKTGSLWLCLQQAPLDVGAVSTFLPEEKSGAVNLFIGTTRGKTGEKATRLLEYEAYEPMALNVLEEIARESERVGRSYRLCIHHRLGSVPVKEASVIVGVSTGHRAEGFAISRFLIDTLKERVPIWKREVYDDGSSEWVQGRIPPPVAS